MADRDQQRSAVVDVKSMMDGAMLQLCWQKTDKKSKKLDFVFKRNTALSDEAADLNTLDSLKDDLALLKDELEGISRNIQKKKDLEDEHSQLTQNAASRQTQMSILKMLIVIGICVGQVYMITQHFQGKQNKRHQVDPFSQGGVI